MPDKPTRLWDRCLQSIQGKIQRQSFATWFSPTSSSYIGPDRAIIEVPSSFFADWLEEHYAWLIRATIEEEMSWTPQLEFVLQETHTGQHGPVPFSDADRRRTASAVQEKPALVPPESVKPTFPLNPRYRFEHFVVGESNEFSFTAAHAVAEAPGKTAFNPLVIYGGVGLGKTHLLQAIGDFCARQHTAQNLVYVTAEKFISDYISSIRNNDTSEFVDTYRTADVLLVDDIQFFVQTEGSQREFFHTFNTLYQNDKQIVLSSDCPPSALRGFEERLISRFQSGLVTGIDAPDLETRIAILTRKAEEQDVLLSEGLARFIAEQIDSNIRELEGALKRLVAFATLRRVPLSVDLARQVLQVRPRAAPSPRLNIEQIQKLTSDFFRVSLDQLVGATRKQEIATARHVSMYLCKSLTGAPLKAIGSYFGNRDHTTVIHACRSVEQKLTEDPEFEDMVSHLKDRLQGRVLN